MVPLLSRRGGLRRGPDRRSMVHAIGTPRPDGTGHTGMTGLILHSSTYIYLYSKTGIHTGTRALVRFVPILLYVRFRVEIWLRYRRSPLSTTDASQKIRTESKIGQCATGDLIRLSSNIHGPPVCKNMMCDIVLRIGISIRKIPYRLKANIHVGCLLEYHSTTGHTPNPTSNAVVGGRQSPEPQPPNNTLNKHASS